MNVLARVVVAMRFALPLVLLVLAAGCLEEEGPAPTPTPTTPTVTTPAVTTPAGPRPVFFREIDASQQSGYQEPDRLVITDNDAWRAFWQVHATDERPAEEVDFSMWTVVAATLGEKGNGCWAVEVTDVREQGAQTLVAVTTYVPPPDLACIAVVSYPAHVVAIEGAGRNVEFTETDATYPPA